MIVTKCLPSTPRQYDLDLKSDPPAITFRPCGYRSTYPVDLESRYCRLCKVFPDLEEYEPLHDRSRYDE